MYGHAQDSVFAHLFAAKCPELLMFNGSDAHLIILLEHTLVDSRLLAEIEPDLIRLISPDDGTGHWPHVLVLLHLLESPRVFSELTTESFPGELAKVLEAGLKTAGISLGFRPVGPLHIQTMQVRQRFDSEQRKYELVSRRLAAGVEQTEAVRMLGAYLDTGAGPLFVEAFREQFSELLIAAEALRKEQLAQLLTDSELIDLLKFEDVSSVEHAAEEIKRRLSMLSENMKNPQMILARALREGVVDAQLVAISLAGYLRLSDLTANLLELVLKDSAISPQAAVVAAYLSPEMTRQMLSDLLADMMYGNPEDPDMLITPAREIAIVTARCVLPRIGSPLAKVGAGEIPSSRLPEQIESIWQTWALML